MTFLKKITNFGRKPEDFVTRKEQHQESDRSGGSWRYIGGIVDLVQLHWEAQRYQRAEEAKSTIYVKQLSQRYERVCEIGEWEKSLYTAVLISFSP